MLYWRRVLAVVRGCQAPKRIQRSPEGCGSKHGGVWLADGDEGRKEKKEVEEKIKEEKNEKKKDDGKDEDGDSAEDEEGDDADVDGHDDHDGHGHDDGAADGGGVARRWRWWWWEWSRCGGGRGREGGCSGDATG